MTEARSFTAADQPASYFHSLGGLHDAGVLRMCWRQEIAELSLELDDLNANFEGLPEYAGKEPATVCFAGVDLFECQVGQIERRMNISDLTVTTGGDSIEVRITTWATMATMTVRCSSISVKPR